MDKRKDTKQSHSCQSQIICNIKHNATKSFFYISRNKPFYRFCCFSGIAPEASRCIPKLFPPLAFHKKIEIV